MIFFPKLSEKKVSSDCASREAPGVTGVSASKPKMICARNSSGMARKTFIARAVSENNFNFWQFIWSFGFIGKSPAILAGWLQKQCHQNVGQRPVFSQQKFGLEFCRIHPA